MGQPTPGYLRGGAVNQIIGIMHEAHVSGAWAVESVRTERLGTSGHLVAEGGTVRTTIVFVVGVIMPGHDIRIPDDRTRVTVTVEESTGQ